MAYACAHRLSPSLSYEEIRQDRHPVIILCGRDLAQILIRKGLNSGERVGEWLAAEFPKGWQEAQ